MLELGSTAYPHKPAPPWNGRHSAQRCGFTPASSADSVFLDLEVSELDGNSEIRRILGILLVKMRKLK